MSSHTLASLLPLNTTNYTCGSRRICINIAMHGLPRDADVRNRSAGGTSIQRCPEGVVPEPSDGTLDGKNVERCMVVKNKPHDCAATSGFLSLRRRDDDTALGGGMRDPMQGPPKVVGAKGICEAVTDEPAILHN